jgi:hypothetical protein
MRAAILHSVGGDPEVGTFEDATPSAHGNGHLAFELVPDAYAKLTELTELTAAGHICVPVERFSLDDAVDAWRAQAQGPHRKLVVEP